jgi:hypothetical protein
VQPDVPAAQAVPAAAPEATLKPVASTSDLAKIETGPLEIIGDDGQVRLMTRREAREAMEALQKKKPRKR